MEKLKYSTLRKCISKFTSKRIMVIGDLLLDQYIWGDVSRISPEAPVPVVWVKREEFLPGGACNVANNLSSFGTKVLLVGVTGDDVRGELLKEKLMAKGVVIDGIFTDSTRPTSLKTRVIAHSQQVVRIDREDINTVGDALTDEIARYVHENIHNVDAVVIEDYGKGVITPALLKVIVPLARKNGKIVSVDPKENHFSFYKGVSVITPNHHEAEKAVGYALNGDADIEKAGEKLLKKLKTDNVLITLGEKGMVLFDRSKKVHRIPTLAREVFDVSGAGDTVIAVYTLALACGVSPAIAAHIANCAAGIVVGKVGAAVVTEDELLERLGTITVRKER